MSKTKLDKILIDLRSGMSIPQIASAHDVNETYVRAVKNLSGISSTPANVAVELARKALEKIAADPQYNTTVVRLAARIAQGEYNRIRANKLDPDRKTAQGAKPPDKED